MSIEEDDSQFAARLTRVLHDQPVPEGLQARLLDRLEQECRTSDQVATFNNSSDLNNSSAIGDALVLRSNQSPADREKASSWRSRTALALVATIVIVAVGFAVTHSPRRVDQLASYCISELQQNSGQSEWTMDQPDIAQEIRLLSWRHRLSFAGLRELSPNRFGNPCWLWRLQQPNQQVLFVFEFQSPVSMEELSNRMRAIRGPDSSWSFAAAHYGDRILLIATRGDITPFVESGAFA